MSTDAQPYRRWLVGKLEDALQQEAGDEATGQVSRREIALRIAMLPSDHGQASHLFDALLTAQPPEFVTIRDALMPHRDALANGLWQALADPPRRSHNPRLQAAAALAAFDPGSSRWPDLAETAASELVSVRSIHLESWLGQLEPIGARLVEPLSQIFHDKLRPAEQRQAAAEALARYASDQPDRLFELTLVADRTQFGALVPRLAAYRAQALDFFAREINHDPWRWRWPSDPSWADVPTELTARIEATNGMVHKRFAYVVQTPFDDQFAVDCNTLAKSGYRPIRVRPYATAQGLLVAAIWHRDGRQWEMARALTAEGIEQRHDEMAQQGYLVADVAGYVTDGAVGYTAVWHQSDRLSTAKTLVEVGLDDQQFARLSSRLVESNAVPVRRQTFLDAELIPRHCLVLRVEDGFDYRWETLEGDRQFYYEKRSVTRHQADVSMCRDPAATGDPEAIMAGIWLRGDETEVGTWIHPTSASTHRHASSQYLELNLEYVPMGIAAAELAPGGRLWFTSIWHRPFVSWRGNAEVQRRKANAAIAMLLLGHDQPAFDALAFTPDPTLRSYLVDRLAALGVPAQRLFDRLSVEQDVTIRRALLWALAEYSHHTTPPGLRSQLASAAAKLYEFDPDAGVHGAADRLLRSLGEPLLLADINRRLADLGEDAALAWFHAENGHVMSIVDAGEFQMGFRPNDQYRNSAGMQHLRRINRRYAIATKETTVEQFRHFLDEHPQLTDRESEGLSARGGPQLHMTFLMAANYCNWLSEKAGIPKDQWCYLVNEQGEYGDGMRIPANVHKRTGYRLASDAEWEFACRSGTETIWYFGEAPELIAKYAWHAGNSGFRANAVGRLRPNDWGLFDMLGNGGELTHTPYFHRYLDLSESAEVPDVIDDIPDGVTVSLGTHLVHRGGGFEFDSYAQTAARRGQVVANGRSRMSIVRVAKTMPAQAGP